GIGMKPFVGAALTTNEDRYRKFSFDDITDEYKGSGKEDNSFSTRVQGGWVSMVQHYFISAWVPDSSQENSFFLGQAGKQDIYLLRFTSPAVTVAPGDQETLRAQ